MSTSLLIFLYVKMLDDEVKQILEKYQNRESEINVFLEKGSSNVKNVGELGETVKKYPSLQGAIIRNKEIVNDLEIVKGSLRSKAIYSPSEMQWESICKHYQAAPSLPVSSWKCHMSVFI